MFSLDMNESAATVLGTGRRQMQGQGDDRHTIDSDDEEGFTPPLPPPLLIMITPSPSYFPLKGTVKEIWKGV